MSDLKAKIHQNRFRLGLCPRPCWGSLQLCHRCYGPGPGPLTGFKGSTSKGKGGVQGRGGVRVGKGKKGGKGKEGARGRKEKEREGREKGRGRKGTGRVYSPILVCFRCRWWSLMSHSIHSESFSRRVFPGY